MTILSVPFILSGNAFFGVTLALGALAGALSETDDHPRGRIKALLITIISFLITALSVELLRNYPAIFAIGFVSSTILFVVLGGVSERYRGISFGAILVGIYAMIGADSSPVWFWQPILLGSGALFYGLLSLLLLIARPMRLLEEQLAEGFIALSEYLREKSNLFPSNEQEQAAIRNRLSMLNVKVVNSLERIKEVINSYSDVIDDQNKLTHYLQRFMLLQALHERAASSHERYEQISHDKELSDIVEGFGELLRQLSVATRLVAESMLIDKSYKHPVALSLVIKALEDQLGSVSAPLGQSMQLLLHNLVRSHESLRNLNNPVASIAIPRLKRDTRTFFEKLTSLLNLKHQRMRYAIRLSCSFLLGYMFIHFVQIDRGEWVLLTSLFVSQPSYSETRRRMVQRIAGTITGIISGVLLLQIFTDKAGQTVLMLVAAYAFFKWLRVNYSTAVIFITIFVLCANNLISLQGFDIMFPRLIATLIGAGLSILVIRFLWPDWQYKRLPDLLSAAIQGNLNYFKAVIKEHKQGSADDYDYRVARRQAHIADNELALSWRGMRIEPKSRRHLLQKSFNFTYLNHALLSYLSALGAHRDSNRIGMEEQGKITKSIAVTLEQLARYLSGKNNQLVLPDIEILLHELKQMTESSENIRQQQQIRLLYNITDVISRILQESKDIRWKA